MKKLILAISGVFFLQLGFIAYHADDPAAETSFLVVAEPASDRDLIRSVSKPFEDGTLIAEFEPEFTDNAPDLDQIEHNAARPVFSSQTNRRISRKRPALNTFVSQNVLEELRPVNVKYSVYKPIEFKTQSTRPRTEHPQAMADTASRAYELNAKVVPKRKTKTFFAKSLTIIKKPYDWLKAVGSALK